MSLRRAACFLECPECEGDLVLTGRSLRCPAGHFFPVARQGYVNLGSNGHHGSRGDEARGFPGSESLEAIADAVSEAATEAVAGGPEGCVVDLGAGSGRYLARVLDALEDRVGLILDSSRGPLRRAARAHSRAAAVAWDGSDRLPLRTGSAALVLSVFAPRNGAEIERILHPDGALIYVWPGDPHPTIGSRPAPVTVSVDMGVYRPRAPASGW